jgi:hypothetical protein
VPIPAPAEAVLLFTAGDLGEWLGRTVGNGKATMVERVVWGWLKPVLGAETRPDPVPAEVFSWAVELGAIAHENPAGLSSKELGPGKAAFSAERRAEILRDADAYGGGTSALSPQGSFPPAPVYPDPARW